MYSWGVFQKHGWYCSKNAVDAYNAALDVADKCSQAADDVADLTASKAALAVEKAKADALVAQAKAALEKAKQRYIFLGHLPTIEGARGRDQNLPCKIPNFETGISTKRERFSALDRTWF